MKKCSCCNIILRCGSYHPYPDAYTGGILFFLELWEAMLLNVKQWVFEKFWVLNVKLQNDERKFSPIITSKWEEMVLKMWQKRSNNITRGLPYSSQKPCVGCLTNKPATKNLTECEILKIILYMYIYMYVMSVVESECTVAFTSHLSVCMKLIWLNYNMYKALVSALTMYRTYLCGIFVYAKLLWNRLLCMRFFWLLLIGCALFEGKPVLEKYLNFNGQARKIWQNFSFNWDQTWLFSQLILLVA